MGWPYSLPAFLPVRPALLCAWACQEPLKGTTENYCWKKERNFLLDKLACCLNSAVCSQQGAGRWNCTAWPRASEWALLLQTLAVLGESWAALWNRVFRPLRRSLHRALDAAAQLTWHDWNSWLSSCSGAGSSWEREGRGSGEWWLFNQPAHLNVLPQTRGVVSGVVLCSKAVETLPWTVSCYKIE